MPQKAKIVRVKRPGADLFLMAAPRVKRSRPQTRSRDASYSKLLAVLFAVHVEEQDCIEI